MVPGVNVPIHLRDRIETLKTCVGFVGWQTIHGRADETIFEGLHEPEFVSFHWSTECQPWCESFNSSPLAATPPKPWEKTLRFNIEIVCTGTRCYSSYAAGEFAVLRGVGIREHLDRFNCFNRQVKRKLACDWIGD